MPRLIGIPSRAVKQRAWRAAAALCYRRSMSTRKRTRRRRRAPARTARPVRIAAARAVDAVLGSRDAFALLVRRLEAAGWRVERESPAGAGITEGTPAARDR